MLEAGGSFWVFVASCHHCSNSHLMKKRRSSWMKTWLPWFFSSCVFYILARQLYVDPCPQLQMTAENMMSVRTVVTTTSDESWEYDDNENRCHHSFRWQLRVWCQENRSDPSFRWQLSVWCQWEPWWPQLQMTAESVISMRTVVTKASDDSWEYDVNENRSDHSFWWQLRVWYQWEP